ncbi:MAG: DegT/DnrJ/EryC1/StrS aminotransferase family protein [Caldilineaceae bacterium]
MTATSAHTAHNPAEIGGAFEDRFLPYGRQSIDEDDIQAVVDVLRSDWLTTGPKVAEFEHAFAAVTGAAEAVAISNGTAALHAAVYAAGIGPGDEVIATPMTFAASANCVVYQGATPVFADVNPTDLLLDPAQVAARITERTKAIIAVDYAGQPCDYDALRELADAHDLTLIADACHSLGGSYKGRSVGALADLSTFSLHRQTHHHGRRRCHHHRRCGTGAPYAYLPQPRHHHGSSAARGAGIMVLRDG